MSIALLIFNLLTLCLGIKAAKFKGFFIALFILAFSNSILAGISNIAGTVATTILLILIILFQLFILITGFFGETSNLGQNSALAPRRSTTKDSTTYDSSNQNAEESSDIPTTSIDSEELVDLSSPSESSVYDYSKFSKPIPMGIFGSVKGNIMEARMTSRYNITAGKSYKIHDHIYDEAKFNCPHFYYIKDNNGNFIWVESDLF